MRRSLRPLILVVAGLLFACSSATTSSTPAPAGPSASGGSPAPTAAGRPVGKSSADLLRVALGTDERALTPFNYNTGLGITLMNLIYDPVTAFDPNGTIRPWLAQEVKPSADAKTYAITLRSGVRYHDGQPLVGDDVKWTFETIRDTKGSGLTANVRNVQAVEVSGLSVTVTLKNPDPEFPYLMSLIPILPKRIWDGTTDLKGATFKIGTGSYLLAEVKPGELYRFKAFADYYRGKPTVNEIVMPIFKDQNSQVAALRSGEIDMLSRSAPPELIKDFQNDPNLKLARGSQFVTNQILLNNTRPGLTKKEARQAIGYALDTKAMVDTLLLGAGTDGNPGWFHPESPVHDPNVRPVARDLTKANALLDGLGYSRGPDGTRVAEGKPMDYTILAYANNPERVRGAELVASYLKDIGIKATVKSLEMQAVDDLVAGKDFDRTNPQDYDIAVWGWSASVQQTPGKVVQILHSDPGPGPFNLSIYKNPQMDALLDELGRTVDQAKRLDLFHKIEALCAEDRPFVVWGFPDGVFVYRPQVYDNLIYVKGQGIFNPLSFLPPQS